jgi:vacuolar-type H+-ATPase subunit H
MENLTKREYFAGLAMQSLITKFDNNKDNSKDIAYVAVKYADTLIEKLDENKDDALKSAMENYKETIEKFNENFNKDKKDYLSNIEDDNNEYKDHDDYLRKNYKKAYKNWLNYKKLDDTPENVKDFEDYWFEDTDND